MIPARPRLASRARLRRDGRGTIWVLTPERGLRLDARGAAIIALCDGSRSIEDIAAALCARFAEQSPGDVTRDVREFLERLTLRRVVEEGA